jgi:FkbM family methyltransferase
MPVLRTLLRSVIPSFIVDEMRRRRASERDTLARVAFYRQLVGPGRTVFDVGANIGTRVDAFLRINSRVVAIEPQPGCVAVLRRRFGKSGNLSIVEKALGDSPGKTTLHWSSEIDVLATVSDPFLQYARRSERFKGADWEKSRLVEVTTLDHLTDIYGIPEFIKIDVEGHELAVLMGLSRAPSCLSFEFTPDFQENVAACLSQCVRIGLTEFNISYGESMRFARREWVSENRMIQLAEALRGDTWLFGDIYARRP